MNDKYPSFLGSHEEMVVEMDYLQLILIKD